jgi:hypothetical protein
LGKIAVVVGGAAVQRLSGLASRFPNLPATAWHSDPSLESLRRLQLSGFPPILGMRGGTIEWTLSGVLADERTIESVVRSWIEKR